MSVPASLSMLGGGVVPLPAPPPPPTNTPCFIAPNPSSLPPPPTNTPFSLNPNPTPSTTLPSPTQVVFRNVHKLLVDTATAEYLFCLDFWEDEATFTQLAAPFIAVVEGDLAAAVPVREGPGVAVGGWRCVAAWIRGVGVWEAGKDETAGSAAATAEVDRSAVLTTSWCGNTARKCRGGEARVTM